MNERKLKRLFPKASGSFIALNSSLPEPDEDNLAPVMQLDVESLYSCYLKEGSVHKVGSIFGTTGDTVHNHLRKAGKKLNNPRWSAADVDSLRDAYSDPEGVNLAILAKRIGRTHASIACKAEEIGLTSRRGKAKRKLTAESRAASSARTKNLWMRQPHPKGMAGKTHSSATRAAISASGMGRVVPSEQTLRSLKTRLERYGTLCTARKGATWKAGWRDVAGRRIYARSRWEANYARYLQFLKERGEISEWEHEPETFWFDAIKRGCRSYLPDFRVTGKNGEVVFHEVKGWMDARSKTKLRRMKKYHPGVRLILIQAKWFKSNGAKLRGILPEWE